MLKLATFISYLASRITKDEKGSQLVETAIWLGLISAVAAGLLTTTGGHIKTILGSINGSLVIPP
jgi:Flp pilus assembly pilin Flp